MLNKAGDPSKFNYLFMGDYVDRGIFGLECMILLIAIKNQRSTKNRPNCSKSLTIGEPTDPRTISATHLTDVYHHTKSIQYKL